MVATPYEESRRKRMEENRKRMEALNLPHLSQSLRKSFSRISKPLPSKPRTTGNQLVAVRRSRRVANEPAPVFEEVIKPRSKTSREDIYDKYKDYSKRVYASDEDRLEALDRAEKLQSKLNSPHPIFIRTMLQSHVTGEFRMGFPADFCKKNLPNHGEVMTLIDEDGNESPATYAVRHGSIGFSSGWRGFAIAHKLADGDALIFELVKRTAFKVYIIRVNGPSFRG